MQRALFGDFLVQDTTGKADTMFQGYEHADWGDEVKAASRRVAESCESSGGLTLDVVENAVAGYVASR